MERDQAVRLTQNLLRKMVESNGSDLFITADFPPAIKIDGAIKPFADKPLTSQQSSLIVRSIMNDKQAKEFDARSEEHTSELQSRENLVCRLLLEKKKIITKQSSTEHQSTSALNGCSIEHRLAVYT